MALIDNDLFLESNKNADLLFYLNLHNKYLWWLIVRTNNFLQYKNAQSKNNWDGIFTKGPKQAQFKKNKNKL